MRFIRGFFYIGLFFAIFAAQVYANPERVVFQSPIVWRGDGQGDYVFKGNGRLWGTTIAKDGAIEYLSSPGVYELTVPQVAEGLVLNLTLSWKFTGNVTMEASVSDIPDNYVPVVNGVPYEVKANFGRRLKWKATLSAGSRLTEVRLVYTDITGVAATFGEPKLTGFKFRKKIVLGGMTGKRMSELFNYQVKIKVGESEKAKDCDVYLKNSIEADFKDIAFTSTDGQTLIPYYREIVSGLAGERVAVFWLKVPQLPPDGLPIYIYYGRAVTEDLSNAEETFEFYDDLTNFNNEKWDKYDFKEGILEYKDKRDNTIKTLDIKTTRKEDIVKFFQVSKDYEWARVRKEVSEWQSVRVSKFQEEETTNLAAFIGTTIAPNGDLVLDEGVSRGEYYSPVITAPFTTRIMVPSWKVSGLAGERASGLASGAVSVAITADAKAYKENCLSENYYYASKNDFVKGNQLRWKARLGGEPLSGLTQFTLDFRPGAITIISPANREKVAAGEVCNIKWSALEYEPSYPFRIEYQLQAKTSILQAKIANGTGVYGWLVPKTALGEAVIKVIDAYDTKIYSKSKFSIEPPGVKLQTQGASESQEELELQRQIEQEAKALAEEEEKTQSQPGLYEVALKIYEKDEKAKPGFYEEGDIVMIKPAGFLWGAEERRKFLIIQARLSEKEAKELMAPEESSEGKVIKKRKFKINLSKQNLLEKKRQALAGMLKAKPLLLREGIEEKK